MTPGVTWMRLEEKKSGDPTTFKIAAAQIESELLKKRYDAWVEEKRQAVRIEILRPNLRRPGT